MRKPSLNRISLNRECFIDFNQKYSVWISNSSIYSVGQRIVCTLLTEVEQSEKVRRLDSSHLSSRDRELIEMNWTNLFWFSRCGLDSVSSIQQILVTKTEKKTETKPETNSIKRLRLYVRMKQRKADILFFCRLLRGEIVNC